jgi:hypothetical protein
MILKHSIILYNKQYKVFVKPIKSKKTGKTYGDYWRLINALLKRITQTQLQSITIETPKYKRLILFHELVACFEYNKYEDNYGRQACICGVHIEDTYVIRNYEKEREDAKAEFYPIGSVCIDNWKDFASYAQQGQVEKEMLENDRKKDSPITTRCYFCNRKTTRTRKDANNNCHGCTIRNICRKYAEHWLQKANIRENRERIWRNIWRNNNWDIFNKTKEEYINRRVRELEEDFDIDVNSTVDDDALMALVLKHMTKSKTRN